MPTFESAAEEQHSLRLSAKPLREGKGKRRTIRIVELYAYPVCGSKRVNEVSSTDVFAAINQIWEKKPDTARRLKQKLGLIFKYAIAKDWRNDNPLDKVNPLIVKHDRDLVKHMPALPYIEMPGCLVRVKASGAMEQTKLAIEFTALTVGRSGEIRGATWDEIDEERAVWIIPKERMKNDFGHRVPLVPRALEILQEVRQYGDDSNLVFPGQKRGRPLSDVTLTKLLKALGFKCVLHGLRSSFRDWAAECTEHPREVIEMCLSHVVADRVERAYFRTDIFAKRRRLLEEWANYLAEPRAPANMIRFPGSPR